MILHRFLPILSMLGAGLVSAQDSTPRAPNLEPFDSPVPAVIDDYADEEIDPFLGGLRLKHVDMHLPGNGGLDIDVVRAYASAKVARERRAEFDPYTPKPLGWTVHFGRILVKQRDCSAQQANTNSMPVLELQDGTRRLVWPVRQAGSPAWMTLDGWAIECTSGGYIAKSPTGVHYEMNYRHDSRVSGSTPCPNPVHPSQTCTLNVYSTTRIVDGNGNWAAISYRSYVNSLARGNQIPNEPMLERLTTNDGRSLTFVYSILGDSEENKAPYLSTVVSGAGRKVTYSYRKIAPTSLATAYVLSAASNSVGQSWAYDYYVPELYTNPRCTTQITCPAKPEDYRLKSVILPWGGSRIYTWSNAPTRSSSEPIESTAVAISGKVSSDGGRWSFSYQYDVNQNLLITRVSSPKGQEMYAHRWERWDNNRLGTAPGRWMNGLLLYRGEGGDRETAFEWKGQPIADNWGSLEELGGIGFGGVATRPILLSKQTLIAGAVTNRITYTNFDIFGNPRTISEQGPNGGNRTTAITYFNDVSRWIIGRVQNESFPGSSVVRVFDQKGNLRSHSKDGVMTSYEYDDQGNLASKTLPRGLVHRYSNYKRGIAQSESQPEGVNLFRVVDDHGNIVASTNAEGYTRQYAYDGIGRVISETLPRGNSRSIVYTPTSMTVTRGGLVETTQYDGFGRPISVTRGGIRTSYAYDALGRVVFESNPNSSGGTSYAYDTLDRLKMVVNADGTSRSYSYGAGTTRETDERGKVTTRAYRSYGEMRPHYLMSISFPETSSNILLTRDAQDRVVSVRQGGWTRSYAYNASGYLVSETHPETGVTSYGRDPAGNMISRRVGATPEARFTFDGQNRRVFSAQGGGAPDVSYAYDKEGRLIRALASTGTRTYAYDPNGNLTREVLQIDGLSFAATYAYDGNDNVSSITYPISNRTVSYAPDALGRPTQVSGYINSVSYLPSGGVGQIAFANGVVTALTETPRLLPKTISVRKVGGSTHVGTTYTYDGANNLTAVADSVFPAYNRNFTYDGMNRLVGASGPWGAGSIVYNGSGDIVRQTYGTQALNYSYDSSNRLRTLTGSASSVLAYDAYGNVVSNSGSTYSYDGASNLRCINCGSVAGRIEYAYDGTDYRSKIVKGGAVSYEMYGRGGLLLVDYAPGNPAKLTEYIYLGNQRVAQRVSQ